MKQTIVKRILTSLGLRRDEDLRPLMGQIGPPPPRTPQHDWPSGPLPSLFARRSYTEAQKAAVWQKAQPIIGWDPNDWRADRQGNPLFRHAYRDTGSEFCWEIGQAGEVREGDPDDIANLRPRLCGPRATERPLLAADPFGKE